MATDLANECINMAKIGFDQALEIFLDKFLELHPKSEWPSWFISCTTYGGTLVPDKFWRFAFSAVPKQALGEGESWESTPNGGFALVKVDPETGERRYVISNAEKNIITIFEAVIDPVSAEISVIVDKDLSAINGEELLPFRK